MNTLVASSLQREERVCGLVIEELKEKCESYERRYKMSNEEFYNKFTNGKMGDELDYFKWKALIDGMKEWKGAKISLKDDFQI